MLIPIDTGFLDIIISAFDATGLINDEQYVNESVNIQLSHDVKFTNPYDFTITRWMRETHGIDLFLRAIPEEELEAKHPHKYEFAIEVKDEYEAVMARLKF